jgi:hypothetical protein
MSLTLAALLSVAQATPVQVKVENHSLGETAEQFFSESKEGVMLNACATKDFGKVNRTIKKTAKEYCAQLSAVRQRMVGGESGDYKDELSTDETKTTTYVFAAGKFVAAEILFIAPDMENNNQGKSFEDIFNGLKGTYGQPTNETVVAGTRKKLRLWLVLLLREPRSLRASRALRSPSSAGHDQQQS